MAGGPGGPHSRKLWEIQEAEERSLFLPVGVIRLRKKRGGNRLSSWGLYALAGGCLCALGGSWDHSAALTSFHL